MNISIKPLRSFLRVFVSPAGLNGARVTRVTPVTSQQSERDTHGHANRRTVP